MGLRPGAQRAGGVLARGVGAGEGCQHRGSLSAAAGLGNNVESVALFPSPAPGTAMLSNQTSGDLGCLERQL